MNILHCENISFSYPLQNGDRRFIIRNFDFSLNQGEFLTLLGPSGCGKTTLLNLFSGFLPADSGSISFNGNPLTDPFPAGQMIFQDSTQLLPWLTVEENILFPLCRRRFPGFRISPGTDQKEKLDEILNLVGLTEFREYHPVRLSGGMKQRCALGRALMADPRILYMDEPFGALDTPSRIELQSLILKLWEEKNVSVIFVTHDISEALILSDRILQFGSPGISPRELPVNLTRPRDRKDNSFKELEWQIYSSLADTERIV
ncbi:MAG: ABC transporter ATP-binding protein [Spirochaetales bacterium]|nr:ABC transporter ATP-binding protein [Spirochaetales bacterium]